MASQLLFTTGVAFVQALLDEGVPAELFERACKERDVLQRVVAVFELHAAPILALGFSVRARKCFTKLGIRTIEDLESKSGDELLACKHFSVTTLNGVRERLGELGKKLKGE